MTRRRCPAARLILAELQADKAQARFDRTRSHKARVNLVSARAAAIVAARYSLKRPVPACADGQGLLAFVGGKGR